MITSVQNSQIKHIKELHRKKARVKTGMFLIEGFHLLEEACAAKWDIQTVVIKEDLDIPTYIDSKNVIRVSDHVFRHVAQTTTPQGILAVVAMKENTFIQTPLTLLIDAVQDPGNIGTMIRSADAAGFGAVIVGEGSADIYNDKVIRATQGSIFHLPVIQMNMDQAVHKLRENNTFILATALENSEDYTGMKIQEKMALIVGNEGAGVQESLLKKSDQIVRIPIYGKAESLNVSIAASILMYDMKRNIASLS